MIRDLVEIGDQADQYVAEREKSIKNIREEAPEIMKSLRSRLFEMKEQVSQGQFACPADEIRFFKEIKPRLCSHLIYFGHLKYLNNEEPITSLEDRKRFFETQLSELQAHHAIPEEIIHYFVRQLTHSDSLYFIRGAVSAFDLASPGNLFFDRDERFSTLHDQTFASLMAQARIEQYIREKIAQLEEEEQTERFLASEPSPLRWTESKRALMELILLLVNARCFNQGDIDKKTVVRVFEHAFNIQLGDIYDLTRKIRNRKSGRTFLDKLRAVNE